MNMRLKESVLAFCVAVGLAGCVVVISDGGIESGGAAHWNDQGSRQDDELARKVEDALRADPLLKGADLKVSSHDGVVTLRGSVEGMERFDRAIQLARKTEGVAKVMSKLKVEVR